MDFSPDLIEKTKEFFSDRYGTEITDEEARVCCNRMVKHFKMLAKWADRETLLQIFQRQVGEVVELREKKRMLIKSAFVRPKVDNTYY